MLFEVHRLTAIRSPNRELLGDHAVGEQDQEEPDEQSEPEVTLRRGAGQLLEDLDLRAHDLVDVSQYLYLNFDFLKAT